MLITKRLGERVVTFRHESGDPPTLVFVHGASSNYKLHDRLLESLPDWNRIALNLPGRAGTDGPPLDAVTPMAEFVDSVVGAEVEGPYVLVGYSLGGAIALELALREDCGGLVGLVLIATGARLRVNRVLLSLYERTCEAQGVLPAMPPAAFEDGTDASLIAEAAEHRVLTPVGTASMDWRACDGFDRMNAIERITVPTLVIGGSDDVLAPPKFSEFLASTILDSELHILEGARHMMVMERVDEIAPLVASFVSRF